MKTTDFLNRAREQVQRRYQNHEVAYRTYYNTLSHLRSFEQFNRRTSGHQMDESLIKEYKAWLRLQGNSTATINQKLIPILNMMGKEYSHLYEGNRPHRYGDISSKEADRERIRYLTGKQLGALVSLWRREKPGKTRDAMELFLFSFHACGLRLSDIVTLEWSHINRREATLTKRMVKTKTLVTIPLSAPALEILSRWEGRHQRFVFGLLPENFDLSDDPSLSQAIDRCGWSLRARLGPIGRYLDLTSPLGMHMARHTFAVMALNDAHVSVHLISRLLGHTSVVVTEKVYATFLLPTLSQEVRNHLSFEEFRAD